MRRSLSPPGAVLTVLGLLLGGWPHLAQARDRQTLPGHRTFRSSSASWLGRHPASDSLHLTLALPLRHEEELQQFLRELCDPASPLYRRYLTCAQFADRFGTPEADYQ